MSQLIRSEPRFFAKTEAAIYVLENFHMRTWRMLADVYELEPAAAMVFLTICLSAGRPVEPLHLNADQTPRTVSRLAIAQSTGLARETVRRKCAELARLGLIQAHGRKGVAVAPGKRLSEQEPAVLRRALADAHQMIEALFRLGVFDAEESDLRLDAAS
jgi:DNA-binding transcriptional regulator YhcF (GntR family)